MESPKLPEKMKAQFLDAFNTPYALRETTLPKPTSEHDLLIKVDAASYCQ
jgi:propanol-preferring alcohol dehydrogenase